LVDLASIFVCPWPVGAHGKCYAYMFSLLE